MRGLCWDKGRGPQPFCTTPTKISEKFLEGCLSTKPILSAPHLQGPKSNVNVHFHLVNKHLIKHIFNLEWQICISTLPMVRCQKQPTIQTMNQSTVIPRQGIQKNVITSNLQDYFAQSQPGWLHPEEWSKWAYYEETFLDKDYKPWMQTMIAFYGLHYAWFASLHYWRHNAGHPRLLDPNSKHRNVTNTGPRNIPCISAQRLHSLASATNATRTLLKRMLW